MIDVTCKVSNADPFSSAVKLWDDGLVPNFDGKVWRLHSGKSADVVYEWIPEKEREDSE